MTDQTDATFEVDENDAAIDETDMGEGLPLAALLGVTIDQFKAITEECRGIADNWEGVEITDKTRTDALNGLLEEFDDLLGADALNQMQEALTVSGATTQAIIKLRDGLSLVKLSLEKYGPNEEWLRKSHAHNLANEHFSERLRELRDAGAGEATDVAVEA